MNKIIVLMVFCVGFSHANVLEQIELNIKSEVIEKKNLGAANLSAFIDDSRVTMDQRIAAVELARKFKVVNCLGVLIRNISIIQNISSKELLPIDVMYPCVGAIVSIGKLSVAQLTEAIGKENDELRLRLLSYALMKIKPKERALKHLDECLASEITETQRKCFNAAKVEVNKWHDEKQEAPRK